MGVNRGGRFAAITNHYEPGHHNLNLQSRGELVSSFLVTDASPDEYSRLLDQSQRNYNGYGLIFGNFSSLRYQTNRDSQIIDITEGVHGLSNHFLNTPWPRVEEGKQKLLEIAQSEDQLEADQLFDILLDSDASRPDRSEENTSSILRAIDPAQMPIFIRLKDYGTRSSSVVLVNRDGTVTFEERTFEPSSRKILAQRKFEYKIQ